MEANVERARSYCWEVFEAGYMPWAPHIYFPQFLQEDIPRERAASIEMGVTLLSQCRVLVVCGSDITEGMASEIRFAQELGIEVCALDNLPLICEVDHAFSAYIANAEDYHNGQLVGVWLPLPATREEFSETLTAIGVDGPDHPGWFVEKYQSSLESIRSLPEDSDIDELNYLAVKLDSLSDSYKDKELFDLVMLSGGHENTVRYAINVIDNIDCFGLQAIYSPEQYGRQLAAAEQRKLRAVLESMGIMAEERGKEILAGIEHFEKNTDYERLGLERAAVEDGTFTEKGYLSTLADFREVFHDPTNVPHEYRLSDPAVLTNNHLYAPSAKASVMEQIAVSRNRRTDITKKGAPEQRSKINKQNNQNKGEPEIL